MSTNLLQEQIEIKKQELLQIVKEYGFTHPLVISHSQELDRLIYLFMIQLPKPASCM
ncbi:MULTISPECIES: aspartyl-phosphate phosphatase Spo0E family protein [Bacillus cereus group]|uniref:aspartyl-phosphate phosphatase Spo0E family protein n=1 Tax=Bacillus cereus group TaxID=86661 RepID=UPI000BF26FE3|nr:MULTISPECIES: aspartyl-phosphate phosphatase Spo0E family protein [Bacillus cereus group]MBJ8025009.1 aspartyl-phosphate phosphatase Spo0E family protein [Bacillus cereus]MBJ8037485.1 aspartyl-phosphate phosphatase Spo0E family protein [Bacillus cereus]PFB41297.1 stage II sporulation protein E [Bacillus thuringiensis]